MEESKLGSRNPRIGADQARGMFWARFRSGKGGAGEGNVPVPVCDERSQTSGEMPLAVREILDKILRPGAVALTDEEKNILSSWYKEQGAPMKMSGETATSAKTKDDSNREAA